MVALNRKCELGYWNEERLTTMDALSRNCELGYSSEE